MTGDITPAEAIEAEFKAFWNKRGGSDVDRERTAFAAGWEAGAAHAAAAERERIRQLAAAHHAVCWADPPANSAMGLFADLLAAEDTPPATTEETR